MGHVEVASADNHPVEQLPDPLEGVSPDRPGEASVAPPVAFFVGRQQRPRRVRRIAPRAAVDFASLPRGRKGTVNIVAPFISGDIAPGIEVHRMSPGLADAVMLEHMHRLGRPVRAQVLDVGVLPADVAGVVRQGGDAPVVERVLQPELVFRAATDLHQVHMLKIRLVPAELVRALTKGVFDHGELRTAIENVRHPLP
jgi:hypothetical protein